MMKFFTESFRSLLVIMVAIVAAGGIAMAQSTFVNPTAAAPGSNVSAPVHTGSGFQDKAGDFVSSAFGTNNGFCIGASCITAWSQLARGTCQIERQYAKEIPHSSNYGDLCNSKLSASAKSSGWVGVSGDPCSEDTSTCTIDGGGMACVYMRVTCDGVGIPATTDTMDAASAKSSGFFATYAPAVPAGGSDYDTPIYDSYQYTP